MSLRLTPAERAKRYRDRQRGGPARVLKPCGTVAAYTRHKRKGEPVDRACQDAYNAHQRAMYANRRAKR